MAAASAPSPAQATRRSRRQRIEAAAAVVVVVVDGMLWFRTEVSRMGHDRGVYSQSQQEQ
jgi:hypothetical protein